MVGCCKCVHSRIILRFRSDRIFRQISETGDKGEKFNRGQQSESKTMKFDVNQVISEIGPLQNGQVKVLKLTSQLLDGAPILGEDVVVILGSKK